jgi:hypothetical protein
VVVVVDSGVGVRKETLRARTGVIQRVVVSSPAVVVSADREGSIHFLLYLPVQNSVGPAGCSDGIRPEGHLSGPE